MAYRLIMVRKRHIAQKSKWPTEMVSHLAMQFDIHQRDIQFPPWDSEKEWTEIMCKNDDSIFSKMAAQIGAKKDGEFNCDQYWYRESNHSCDLHHRPKMWNGEVAIEVENRWSRIHEEINQLFHLRHVTRVGVFYPPKRISVELAISQISSCLSEEFVRQHDDFLIILGPEGEEMQWRYFYLHTIDKTPSIVEFDNQKWTECGCIHCQTAPNRNGPPSHSK